MRTVSTPNQRPIGAQVLARHRREHLGPRGIRRRVAGLAALLERLARRQQRRQVALAERRVRAETEVEALDRARELQFDLVVGDPRLRPHVQARLDAIRVGELDLAALEFVEPAHEEQLSVVADVEPPEHARGRQGARQRARCRPTAPCKSLLSATMSSVRVQLDVEPHHRHQPAAPLDVRRGQHGRAGREHHGQLPDRRTHGPRAHGRLADDAEGRALRAGGDEADVRVELADHGWSGTRSVSRRPLIAMLPE